MSFRFRACGFSVRDLGFGGVEFGVLAVGSMGIAYRAWLLACGPSS